MILMIDNYDSFTYNLVQYLQILGQDICVYKHDAISIDDIKGMKLQAIIISPGPNSPRDAGISVPVIKCFYQHIPILGVCLGHQAISYAFGGKIISAPEIRHGKTSEVYHHGQGLFNQIPNPTNQMAKDGKFTAEDYGQYSMMKHKGSSLAPLGTFEKKIPAELVAKVRAKEKDIQDGKFNVKVDDKQPKSTAK